MASGKDTPLHLSASRMNTLPLRLVSSIHGPDLRFTQTRGNDVHRNPTRLFTRCHFGSFPPVRRALGSFSGDPQSALFSYQPVDDPLLRSTSEVTGPFHREILRPSSLHPTVQSARITKYLITLLGKNSQIRRSRCLSACVSLAHSYQWFSSLRNANLRWTSAGSETTRGSARIRLFHVGRNHSHDGSSSATEK